jgi:hypothetical protein
MSKCTGFLHFLFTNLLVIFSKKGFTNLAKYVIIILSVRMLATILHIERGKEYELL